MSGESLASVVIHARADGRPAPLRIGVPLARGAVHDLAELALCDATGTAVPAQFRKLAHWPDGSLRWVLIDAVVAPGQDARLQLHQSALHAAGTSVVLSEDEASMRLDTAWGEIRITRGAQAAVAVTRNNGASLGPQGMWFVLTTADGREVTARITALSVEEAGPVSATILAEADFPGAASPLNLQLRITVWSQLEILRIETRLRNPRAAVHEGGLWDLGDPASVLFRDFSVRITPDAGAHRLRWTTAAEKSHEHEVTQDTSLYQDSSGGENWDSPVHAGPDGSPTTSFRGYRFWAEGPTGERLLEEGLRAEPSLVVATAKGAIALRPREFWQNFPMALRWRGGRIEVGLFAGESRKQHELQGGEQKRHVLLLAVNAAGDMALPVEPVEAALHPFQVEHSSAVRYVAAREPSRVSKADQYVDGMLEGDNSVVAKRERVDEYGWRNYGDLYADHEAVRHTGPQPFASHYNNQYDFILGAGSQFLRSGDMRWWHLMDAAARHVADIDIYHTTGDKAAFNGGLFWHTDHYKPAATCTHRTFSAANSTGGSYGGGPGNEHNYTSGLLLHYYLSGDPESAAAVRSLADWVLAMDDGTRTAFALFDEGPTGLASQTAGSDWHKPGRGAGNSINALLDAYVLDGKRHYLDTAEALIRRCVHPADDVQALGLDEPELRWSYLVFLQVLARYLDLKVEWGETGYAFQYARSSLVRYAEWMADHEQHYKDVLHKVEIPTETWPAHDIRKAHILYAAAQHVDRDCRERWRARARQFAQRSLDDLLSFPTANLTRPQVIFCVYGHVPEYYESRDRSTTASDVHNAYDFGTPVRFVPQRARWRATLRDKLAAVHQEVRRRVSDVIRRAVPMAGRRGR